VPTLDAQAGFWLDPTTEALILVDETGRIYTESELLPLMTSLVLRSGAKGVFVVPVSAPSVVEQMAQEQGCSVIRAKTSERSMIESALSPEVVMAGTMDGRFAFPRFQASFDGMFTIAKSIQLVAQGGVPLSRVQKDIPNRTFLQTSVSCVWEMKGGVMRKMSEHSIDKEATFIDGIKLHFGEDWLLVLPDQYRPFVHIIAEAKNPKIAQQLLADYRDNVERWKKELA